MSTSAQQSPELKRSLSLTLVVFYGLGNILGAGIYVLVGKVAGVAGLLAPLSFLISAAIAAASAFSYGELASRYPVSAGEAVYVQKGLGLRPLSIAVGILISLAGMVSAAAISKGFVGYFQQFVAVPDVLAIIGLVFTLGAVAVWGIGQSIMIAAAMTVLEILGLVLIIVVGSPALAELPARLPEAIDLMGEGVVWQAVLLGAFLAFYAFLGFEDMVNVAEEVKNPRRNLPRAMILALIISGLLYFLVSLVAVLVVSPETLSASTRPLALIAREATGGNLWAVNTVSLIGMFAVVNGALIQIIMVARVLYGMSRQGWLPKGMGMVHAATRTPVVATVIAASAVMVLALWVPLVMLAAITSFMILIVFGLVNLSLIIIKRRDPRPEGVVIFPAWIPVVGVFLSVGLIVVSLAFGF